MTATFARPSDRSSALAEEDAEALRVLDALTRLPVGHPGRAARREAAICAFLPLARRLARRYAHGGVDRQDLVQVATVALIGAVDRYDPGQGRNFHAFAVPTIRGELKRYFRDKGWTIQPPRSIQELRLHLAATRTRLVGELCREPTTAELADAVGADVARVREALRADQDCQPVSLNMPCPGPDGTADGTELVDLLGAPDPVLESVPERVSLPAALAQLTDRDRTVILQRFVYRRTQTQIGRALGISQMHVSRLIARALAQLRAYLDGEAPVPPVLPRGSGRAAA